MAAEGGRIESGVFFGARSRTCSLHKTTEQQRNLIVRFSGFYIRPMQTRQTLFDIRYGDCVEGIGQMDSASVDVVVTSPPYNLGIEYGTYQDNKKPEDYLDWCQGWGEQIAKVLRPDGSFF